MSLNGHLVDRAGTGALRVACAAALMSALLHAQARAPFTGTLRDESGKLLADAEVTCVLVPDFAMPGMPDRAQSRSDAMGRFRMELLVGCPYVVWAVGPAGERGVRSMAWPRCEAAGGKALDLIADERRGPVKLRVSGATPWIAEGPLSLRILVGGPCAVGPDLVIPGDTVVNLPPLPATELSVALLDGKGRTIQIRPCNVETDAAVAFAEPRLVSVRAVDQDGKALPGVQVLQQSTLPAPAPGRIPDAQAWRRAVERLCGITGADGTATVAFAGEPGWLLGRMPGYCVCWSGWVHGARVHDACAAQDEGPLLFTMRPGEKRSLHIVGLADDERVDVSFRAWMMPLKGAGGSLESYLTAAGGADGVHAADGAPSGATVTAKVHFTDASPRSRCIVAYDIMGSPNAELDIAQLRRMSVTVVDGDGRPAPCTLIGLADIGCAPHLCRQERLVTDSEGRAEVWLSRQGHWVVYAITGRARAAKLVGLRDEAGPIELKLEPLSLMRLRIVDAARRPVSGARLRAVPGALVVAQDVQDRVLDAVAAATNEPSLDLSRSNAAGEVEVPFFDRQRVMPQFKVTAGRLESAVCSLRAGEEVQEIIVK